MSNTRELGIIVYGATGYTGRLVCEYLNNQYGVGGDVSWAMAGRSQQKLEQVRDEMGIPAEVPMIVADASDLALLRLQQGCYGISEVTGEPISYERLQVVPWAITG